MPASRWIKKWSIKGPHPSKRPDRALFRWPDCDWSATEIWANSRDTHTHTQSTPVPGIQKGNRQTRNFFTETSGKVGIDTTCYQPPLFNGRYQEVFGKGRRKQNVVGSKWALFLRNKMDLGRKCDSERPISVLVPPYHLFLMTGAWSHKFGSILCYTVCNKNVTII